MCIQTCTLISRYGTTHLKLNVLYNCVKVSSGGIWGNMIDSATVGYSQTVTDSHLSSPEDTHTEASQGELQIPATRRPHLLMWSQASMHLETWPDGWV